MAINWDLSYFKPVLAWFFIYFLIGGKNIKRSSQWYRLGSSVAHAGTGFAFASLTNVRNDGYGCCSLIPNLLIVPLFDILMYFNILPKIIGGIGWLLAKVTRDNPKFESFFGIEMMF